MDIGPQETEYGRAIHCDETDSGPLRGLGVTGGTRVPQRWWEQKGLDLELARERAKDAETEETAADGRAAVTAGQAVETPETGQGAEMWSGWEEQLGGPAI